MRALIRKIKIRGSIYTLQRLLSFLLLCCPFFTFGNLEATTNPYPDDWVPTPMRTGQDAPADSGSYSEYVVQDGESLWAISGRFEVSVSRLRQINLLPPGRSLFPGDVLLIPGPTPMRRSSPLSFVEIENLDQDDPSTITPGQLDAQLRPPLPANFLFLSQGYHSQHHGLDFSIETGTPIWSIAHGEVIRVEENHPVYGHFLVVDHGNGITSLYAHLSSITVRTGYIVLQGETIALSGNSGRSTRPHLHFEIRLDGLQVNPCQLMSICPTSSSE